MFVLLARWVRRMLVSCPRPSRSFYMQSDGYILSEYRYTLRFYGYESPHSFY